jgi:carnitine O-acetyltransferase
VQTNQELSPLTFGNEDQLPRVPLPSLEQTCARFLQWCAPLLTDEELTQTKAAVTELLAPGSPGRTLHAALARYHNTDGVHSWLDTFWPYRYLGRRDRIALNANFFFLFEQSQLGQCDRAAGLVAAALNYKLLIDAQLLPPALQRGRPLSMEQNRYLFSCTRIPGTELDTVRTPYTDEWPGPSTERHIVVLHRGRMFRLDVIGRGGHPHTLAEITAALRTILDTTTELGPPEPGTSIGHLTTKARAEWAASRTALLRLDPANAVALDVIETALFCLCLDEHAPADPLDAADALLHGNSANRWFDKGVSLIVFADGTAGFNGEHCKLDGTMIVAFIDAMLSTPAPEHSRRSGARPQGVPIARPLEFVLDDALRADVRTAGEAFTEYAAAIATTTVSIKGFDSERAKELRMSPDAFAQLSFQLAHRRARGITGATYESIATRQFRHGRTEAMRVVTPEVVRFVDAMDDPAARPQQRRAAFRAAAEAHAARAKQCQAGDAPEQHLWELELIGKRRGAELGVTEPLALYSSPGWLIMRDDYLSTSAVPSPRVRYFGFGSTSTTCIGVGYALLPGRFNLYLSTPHAVRAQMLTFADEVHRAVAQLHELLTGEVEE